MASADTPVSHPGQQSSTILDFNGWYEIDVGIVYGQEENLATLDGSARERATTLFSLGCFIAYGAMFNAAFVPTAKVRSAVDFVFGIPNSMPQPFTIGVHSRHTQSQDQGTDVSQLVGCLRKVLGEDRKVAAGKSCRILIAADREGTIDMLRIKAGEEFGCDVLAVGKMQETHGVEKEHGPWSGLGAAIDLELLSRASDGVILDAGGAKSGHSTYGYLGTELAAAAAAAHKIAENKKGGIFTRVELEFDRPWQCGRTWPSWKPKDTYIPDFEPRPWVFPGA